MNNSEKEIIIYARIGNPEGLHEANEIEQHFESHRLLSENNRLRLRKTVTILPEEKDPNFELTFKIKKDNQDNIVNDSIEYNNKIPEEQYIDLDTVCEYNVVKTRYIFNCSSVIFKGEINGKEEEIEIPNIVYEVDVFIDKDEKIAEWCKIEIEIDSILEKLVSKYGEDLSNFNFKVKVSHLPFKPNDCILTDDDDGESKSFIGNLWDHVYKIKK